MSVKIYKLGAGATILEVGLTAIKGGAIGRVLFQGSGSVLQESANLFWDNTNSWLGIGTATPIATIHSVGSVTAATAIARGNYLQPTLIASANNDVLVALDIVPTFTTGAFTGVERNAIRYGTIKIGLNSGGQDRIDFGNQVNISRSNEAILTATTVQTFLSSRSSAAYVAFALNQGITEVGRFAPTTGNFLLNTTTDAGYKLDVNGSVRTTGSISAASLLARGTYLNQTLVATADNDVLVGLDIQSTFTTGAFTGVTSAAIRVGGNIIPSAHNTYDLGTLANRFKSAYFNGTVAALSTYTNNLFFGVTNLGIYNSLGTQVLQFFGTGNLLLQNGGTFTDAGYKLDVNGTARVSGTTTITPAALTGTAATSALDISQTWNTTGTPIALKVNITDTASAALSDLINLQVNGSSRFRIVKSGFFALNSSGEILGTTLIGGTTINTSSQLEVRSTTKGFLPPRMTTAEKNAIASPAAGLMVYDTTLNKLCVRGASAWETITSV